MFKWCISNGFLFSLVLALIALIQCAEVPRPIYSMDVIFLTQLPAYTVLLMALLACYFMQQYKKLHHPAYTLLTLIIMFMYGVLVCAAKLQKSPELPTIFLTFWTFWLTIAFNMMHSNYCVPVASHAVDVHVAEQADCD